MTGVQTCALPIYDRDEAIAYLSQAGPDASFRATTLEDVFVDVAGQKLERK